MTISNRHKVWIAVVAALSLSGALAPAARAASDMPGMDHGTMPGMDHGAMPGMDHSSMPGMNPASPAAPAMRLQAPTESRTPIPALTDADRQAVFNEPGGHMLHDKSINSFFLADRLEWQNARAGSTLNWDVTGWVGGDIDRLWLRSDGEHTRGKLESSEVQALWGHAISPWWDAVGGIRQDFKPGASQTWAAFGLQGLALYNFEAEATAFIGQNGQTAARFKGDYDLLITNRLILQPTAEVNFHGKDDRGRSVGAGLATTEVGLRLRYEIRREFAPYIGVTWNRSYGGTANYAGADGDPRHETRFVAGIRLWF
jgi:copper resistance protein B